MADDDNDRNLGGGVARRRFLKAAGALSVVGLSGCGGDGDDTETPTDTTESNNGNGDTPTETSTETPTETPTPTETQTPTPTDTPGENIPDDLQVLSFEGSGGSVTPGGTAVVTATLTNSLLFALQDVEVTLEAPDDWMVSATGDTSFDALDSQETQQVSWDVTAPESAEGEVTLTVTASYASATDEGEESLSRSIIAYSPGDVPQDGLEAYLPLDSDSPINLVTGRTADVVGDPATGEPGFVENAFQFEINDDTSSAAEAVITSELPLNGEAATVGAWLYYTDNEGAGRVYAVGGTPDASPASGWNIEIPVTGELYHQFWENGTFTRETDNTVPLPTETWLFVVTVITSNEGLLYVFDENGQLEESPITNTGPRAQTDAAPLLLMAGDGRGTAGRIDEVRAYSRALSESEVMELYEGSGGGSA